jgi:hypothetical protein
MQALVRLIFTSLFSRQIQQDCLNWMFPPAHLDVSLLERSSGSLPLTPDFAGFPHIGHGFLAIA